MEGIILRVTMDGNLVRELKFPSSLVKEWDAGVAEENS
jgi:hypothetical protein